MSNLEQLLFNYKQGTLNSEELRILKELGQTDDLDRAAKTIQDIVDSTTTYKVPEKINVQLAWEKFSKNQEFSEVQKQKKYSWLPLGVLSFLIILGFTLWGIYQDKPDTTISASNGVMKFELSDHTKLTLDSNSIVSYAESFNHKSRLLNLNGRAHFDVSHNAKLPFTVKFDNSKLVVVGTDFVVDTKNENLIAVELRSGKIAFYANKDSKPLYITKGQRLEYDKNSNGISVSETLIQSSFYWVDQNLIFKSALLPDVLMSLEEIFGVNYTLNTDKVSNCHLTAEFKKSNLSEIHATLEEILGIKISKINKDNFGIFGGNCQ